MSTVKARVRGADGEHGAYAILYAILVVTLVGMGAIVVDIATLREDRRADRAAADSAVVGAARMLDPNGPGGVQPRKACEAAWSYLINTLLNISKPSGACDPFPVAAPATCPTSQIGAPVAAGNGYFVTIAWPVPQSSPFLLPDLAPGTASQNFDVSVDGPVEGCQRVGVAVEHRREFGLASGLGFNGQTTISHSVARIVPKGGPARDVAALNILHRSACQALSTGGQGRIVINRSTSVPPAQGFIAVESDGSGCSNNNKFVIDLSNNLPNEICASGPTQVPTALGACDGKGRIEQHALDPGGQYPFPPGSGATLRPPPQPEGGVFSWAPVTDIYGCDALPAPCLTEPTHIRQLVAAYDGPGMPTTRYRGINPDLSVTPSTPSGFVTIGDGHPLNPPGFSCAPTNVYIPPGNWYVDCPDSGQTTGFQAGGEGARIVFGGGHIVFRGGIQIAKRNACFAVNVPQGFPPTTVPPTPVACPESALTGGLEATTVTRPEKEAIVFIRGNRGLSKGSTDQSILMPQTFVYQDNNGLLNLGGGTGRVLWTAPGAGERSPSGPTGKSTLQEDCTNLAGAIVTACLDSHFQKLTYWSEKAGNDENQIGGQAGLDLVGTFFAPRETFVFTGQAFYTANGAQFWVSIMELSGQGGVALTPDAELNVSRPTGAVALIR